MDISYFLIHLLMDNWVVSTFWLLWIVLLCTVTPIYVSSSFQFFWIYIQEWSWWIINSTTLNFLRDHQTFSQRSYYFAFLPAMYEGSSSSTLHQHLKKKTTNKAILVSMKCSLIVALICISLLTKDVKYLFTYLLAICTSTLWSCMAKTICTPIFLSICTMVPFTAHRKRPRFIH